MTEQKQVVEFLQNNSPFIGTNNIIKEISFVKGEILADGKSYGGYKVHIKDNEIELITNDLLFENHIKLEAGEKVILLNPLRDYSSILQGKSPEEKLPLVFKGSKNIV